MSAVWCPSWAEREREDGQRSAKPRPDMLRLRGVMCSAKGGGAWHRFKVEEQWKRGEGGGQVPPVITVLCVANQRCCSHKCGHEWMEVFPRLQSLLFVISTACPFWNADESHSSLFTTLQLTSLNWLFMSMYSMIPRGNFTHGQTQRFPSTSSTAAWT